MSGPAFEGRAAGPAAGLAGFANRSKNGPARGPAADQGGCPT